MIILKSNEEIEIMRKANKIVANTFVYLRDYIKPGVSTYKLDQLAEGLIRRNNAIPNFKGYNGYPSTLCVSINEEIVHGIPSKKRFLEEGDIVSLDLGCRYKGYNGDAAVTIPVGNVTEKVRKFIKDTKQCLVEGINNAISGNRLGDISHAIQVYAEQRGYGVIREYVGHGIGRDLHEAPEIPNFGKGGMGPRLRKGMTIAIEPMLSMGDFKVNVLDDMWTAVTADRSLACHFEHSIAITEGKTYILSLPDNPENWYNYF
ncbi:type I methionyl aminopeptidase [candidate division TA06 bacterium]|uniref:Methionine aminopeptidase n=1 Tax=candidate division TA06 bacterium TaxID=2250710 RepID=A0A660SKZ1_UNCT6|nr:MAG: type I methionyl aminopeptidase [candidate division TA06 bacterium]